MGKINHFHGDNILRTKENYDNLYANEEKAEKLLEDERKSATENNSELAEIQENIKTLSTQLGLTDVTGKGVIIKVDDAMVQSTFDPNSTIVHAEDLISIVNELKNAGAESFEINEQRIIFNSVITCKENTIEVNGTSIQSPFIIQAIGDSKMIYNALMRPGGYIELLNKRVDKVQVTKANRITIKKTDAKFSTKYMKTVT